MSMNMGDWKSVGQNDLNLIFVNSYMEFASKLGLIYSYRKPTQSVEYDLETGSFGSVPEYGSTGIAYEDISEGYKKETQEVQYAKGMKVTSRLMRSDLYGVIQRKVRDLARSFNYLRETVGASPFVNAFNSTFTVGDGLSLCNSAHTSKAAGVATQSNTGTAALSAANLFTNAILNMAKFKNNAGIAIPENSADMIIVPVDLSDVAYELISSSGKVDTQLNNKNYYEGKYKLLVWTNFLSGTKAWFTVNSKLMKDTMIFRDWVPTQFFKDTEMDVMTMKFAGFTSFNVSTFEWRWAFGHNPA